MIIYNHLLIQLVIRLTAITFAQRFVVADAAAVVQLYQIYSDDDQFVLLHCALTLSAPSKFDKS